MGGKKNCNRHTSTDSLMQLEQSNDARHGPNTVQYNITVDRRSGASLGIEYVVKENRRLIEKLEETGLVVTWNEAHPESRVRVGDEILRDFPAAENITMTLLQDLCSVHASGSHRDESDSGCLCPSNTILWGGHEACDAGYGTSFAASAVKGLNCTCLNRPAVCSRKGGRFEPNSGACSCPKDSNLKLANREGRRCSMVEQPKQIYGFIDDSVPKGNEGGKGGEDDNYMPFDDYGCMCIKDMDKVCRTSIEAYSMSTAVPALGHEGKCKCERGVVFGADAACTGLRIFNPDEVNGKGCSCKVCQEIVNGADHLEDVEDYIFEGGSIPQATLFEQMEPVCACYLKLPEFVDPSETPTPWPWPNQKVRSSYADIDDAEIWYWFYMSQAASVCPNPGDCACPED